MSWVEMATTIGSGIVIVATGVAAVRAKMTELTGKKDEPCLRDLVLKMDGKLDVMQDGMQELNKRVARVEVRANWGMAPDDITPEKTRPGIGPEFDYLRVRDSVTNERDD